MSQATNVTSIATVEPVVAPIVVEPIGVEQQQQVIEQTIHFIRWGETLLRSSFDLIPIHFDLLGRTAGMYKITKTRSLLKPETQRQIRYNPWIFAKYYEDSLNVTVPHEVAHYLVDCIHGMRNVRPHGVEWKAIMSAFGVEGRATSTFDLEGIPTHRQRQFAYICGCNEHQLGIRRHNKILSGEANYRCRYCGEVLRQKSAGDLR